MGDQHFVDKIFDRYIRDQSRLCLGLAGTLNESLNQQVNPVFDREGYQDQVDIRWMAIAGICSGAANLAKVFENNTRRPRDPGQRQDIWEVTQTRCVRMKERYEVRGEKLFLKRSIRNSFEHFDERIDEYMRDAEVFSDRNISPLGFIAGPPDNVIARLLDPQTGVLHAFGDSIDLNALLAEVNDLHLRATALLGDQL